MGAGSDVTTHPVTFGAAPFEQRFSKNAANKLALVGRVELHDVGDGAANVGIAGGRRIDEMRFEIWPLHGHEIPCVGTAERAMHALALLKPSIGDFRRAPHRFAADRVERTKADDNRRVRCQRAAFKGDVVERQCAGKCPELAIDENAADVVLRKKRLDHPLRQVFVAIGQIDQIGATVGCHHDLRIVLVAANKTIAKFGVLARCNRSVVIVWVDQRLLQRFR